MPVVPITAEREYEKNPDIRKDDIAALQQWMEWQPHLPKVEELKLIIFYHSCNNSMELTKSTIEAYYTLRTQLDRFFKARDPRSTAMMTLMERVMAVPLPELTPEGYKVFYCRLLDYEPSHIHFNTCIKLVIMASDLLEYEQGSFAGVIILVDADHLALGHLTRFTISDLKYSIQYLQEAAPVRLKGIYAINSPFFIDKIMNMAKPFLNNSVFELIKLYSAPTEAFYKDVPQRILPKELGGEAPSFEELRGKTSSWLYDNQRFFADEETMRCNESKRQGKARGDDFGTNGSFKRLNLD